jgi:hypothetical protein
MSSPTLHPETASLRSDSAASTRDSASLLAELASQAILLLQKADPHTVVTGLLKEKSYLHTQNGQLWRLVDKQRAAYGLPLMNLSNVQDYLVCNGIIRKCYTIETDFRNDFDL